MQISARLAMYGSVIFAVLCLGYAFTGFASLGEITDPARLADARGYAWFWAFLGGVAAASGAVSWWIARLPAERGE